MLTFLTPHSFDIRALTIMGVNSKPNTTSPIGYFGTGLKYAVAILARLDCQIEFGFNGQTWFVDKQNTSFRWKDFQELWLRPRTEGLAPIQLPFTTELGKNWTALMAYRELVSNTRDEGGTILEHPVNSESGLSIRVFGEAIDQARVQHSEMFLESTTPLEAFPSVEVYLGSSNQLFYRGVAVYKLEKPSIFTYNILTKCDLTEDRTLGSEWNARHVCISAVSASTNPRVYTRLAEHLDSHFEKDFSFSSLSNAFATYVADQFDAGRRVRLDLVKIAQIQLDRLPKRKSIQLHGSRKAMLVQALAILAHSRIYPDQFPIEVIESLDGKLGEADYETMTISLADRVFSEGMTKLVGTLLEEYIHLNYLCADYTIEFQNHAMDLAARIMIDGFPERS